MIQVYQFFKKIVVNSSIIVPMACEMLPCHFVSIIVHENPGETLDPLVYSVLPTTNNQIRITNGLAIKCPELAPLSALGHISTRIEISNIVTILDALIRGH